VTKNTPNTLQLWKRTKLSHSVSINFVILHPYYSLANTVSLCRATLFLAYQKRHTEYSLCVCGEISRQYHRAAHQVSRITHLFLEQRCRKYFCGSLSAADFYALLVQRRQRSAAINSGLICIFFPRINRRRLCMYRP